MFVWVFRFLCCALLFSTSRHATGATGLWHPLPYRTHFRWDRGDEAGRRDPRPGGHRFRPLAARPGHLPRAGAARPRGRTRRHGPRRS
ncbi:hypothetical protein CCS92_34925, partial [Methylobacterium radiotolerans]